jgi:ribosomal protein L11 methyltransferase
MNTENNIEKYIESNIQQLLGQEILRITPGDLIRKLKERLPDADRRKVRKSIQRLVETGKLIYTHHFSSSHLELNSRGRVNVSKRIVINSNIHHKGRRVSDCAEIKMQTGSAFGSGDHPTTLLALKAMDRISKYLTDKENGRKTICLDIGTGTGVLAIAAAMLGISRAIGLDIDQFACHEAAQNVSLNRLVGRVFIVAGNLDALKSCRYDLIAANLRPFTLSRLMPEMALSTSSRGYWILSGFRPEEMAVLQKELPNGFKSVWQACNRNWAAFAVQRN